MERLNEILHELGISKVKLAKYLGVSRQMIYNYLELDDINKWPKDKKVLLLNLLGIKAGEELEKIKVDTDYIMSVETRINTLFDNPHSSCITIPEIQKSIFLEYVHSLYPVVYVADYIYVRINHYNYYGACNCILEYFCYNYSKQRIKKSRTGISL